MSYTTAGSGKSMARLLAAVIVVSVCASLGITAWKVGTINGAWAAIIASVCALVGTPWAISHVVKKDGQP